MDADRIEFIKIRLQERHKEKPNHDKWLLLSYACGLADGSDSMPIEIIDFIDDLCRR